MKHFHLIFLVFSLIQCNDYEKEYAEYKVKTKVIEQNISALNSARHNLRAIADDIQYSRSASLNFEYYYLMIREIAHVYNLIDIDIKNLEKEVSNYSNLVRTVDGEKILNNKILSKERMLTINNSIDSIINKINQTYYTCINIGLDSMPEYHRRNLPNFKKSFSYNRSNIFEIDNGPQNVYDFKLAILKLEQLNLIVVNNYLEYCTSNLSAIRCGYRSIRHVVEYSSNICTPNSKNYIVVKADNYGGISKKLWINGKIQKEFYDLYPYSYRFTVPLKKGTYWNKVVIETFTPAGEIMTFEKRLKYRVVDTCS